MTRISNLTHAWAISILNLALLGSVVTVAPLFAQDSMPASQATPAKLVQDVRDATRQFLDVNNAGPAGYGPAFGCVSGPDHGAMGIHYVNGNLVGDGEIDVAHPEALIYEPLGDKRRLVGVEYIVDAATWLKNNNNTPPSLDGQDFQFVAAPNRFNLPISLNCTSGPGATTPRVRLWTGTITSLASTKSGKSFSNPIPSAHLSFAQVGIFPLAVRAAYRRISQCLPAEIRLARAKRLAQLNQGQAAPNRWTARALALAVSSSRFFGGALVSSELRRRAEMAATSSTAARNKASLAFDGLLKPVILRTNCSEAARTSSGVTGGSKLKSVLIFLHMPASP